MRPKLKLRPTFIAEREMLVKLHSTWRAKRAAKLLANDVGTFNRGLSMSGPFVVVHPRIPTSCTLEPTPSFPPWENTHHCDVLGFQGII